MNDEGKYASCVYYDKEEERFRYEYGYITMYRNIHKDLIFEDFILDGRIRNDALAIETGDVDFLSSYQDPTLSSGTGGSGNTGSFGIL